MKKIILTGLLIAVTLVSVNAQNFGVKSGVDFATVKAKYSGETVSENETGFYIGVFTTFEVSESFNLRPEINFISIKDLDQIQIPVLAEVSLGDSFNILVGPSLGFLLDTEEGINSINFGVDLGLSYDITENFLLEARYDYGLSNLLEDGDSDNSIKLSGLHVGIGYKF